MIFSNTSDQKILRINLRILVYPIIKKKSCLSYSILSNNLHLYFDSNCLYCVVILLSSALQQNPPCCLSSVLTRTHPYCLSSVLFSSPYLRRHTRTAESTRPTICGGQLFHLENICHTNSF